MGDQLGNEPSGDREQHHDVHRIEYAYLVPAELDRDKQITFAEVWQGFWQSKWLVASVMAFFLIVAGAYAALSEKLYTSTVLLAPAESQTSRAALGSQLGVLGGLAGLAGIRTDAADAVEAIAVLTSRDFLRDFIASNNLMPQLYSDLWDSDDDSWESDDPAEWPDIHSAVHVFREDILDVSKDRESGLVTLSIEWSDPVLSSVWAEALVARLNERMRNRALVVSQKNVEYLQAQLQETSVMPLRESIANLLESELQRLMLARGNDEYAFRILDSAQIPKTHSHPKRLLIISLSGFLGAVCSFFLVFFKSQSS